ncbi:uncharacterized protein KY384_004779 [Bacidia gigantensis]|uniref:uncharacterized protein n=1 Tax=Bacidia gigantensis TaxID=2732470 RepID=UPI001D03FE09|nr:uncharacterized protein KY384_004779 [Bacidia gigantensis]KAG8530278.1 hypothetical protein KY384_004779 [Bacidia gigantensis]
MGRIVSVLGGITQDMVTITERLPDNGETVTSSSFTMSPGGKGANSAVAVHRLTRPNPKNHVEGRPKTSGEDIQVRMVGAVGDDEFGPALKQCLYNCGVNADGVSLVPGRNGIAVTLVEEKTGANRIMQFPGAAYKRKAEEFLTLESLGGGVKPDLVIAQLELHRETVEQAIETAYLNHIEVLLNPSPAFYLLPDIYPMITHLVMNETEAVLLSLIKPDDIVNQTGWTSVTEYFQKLGVKNIVITLGEKGAYFLNEWESGYVEAEKDLRILDTAGAGDSFVGGYTASYMAQKLDLPEGGKWDIKAAISNGNKAAARIIEHVGCLEPICWADEVDKSWYDREPTAIGEVINAV